MAGSREGEKQVDQPLLLADLESSPRPSKGRAGEGLGRRATLPAYPGSQATYKYSQSSMHTCSSYCLEAISHKMARICSAF